MTESTVRGVADRTPSDVAKRIILGYGDRLIGAGLTYMGRSCQQFDDLDVDNIVDNRRYIDGEEGNPEFVNDWNGYWSNIKAEKIKLEVDYKEGDDLKSEAFEIAAVGGSVEVRKL